MNKILPILFILSSFGVTAQSTDSEPRGTIGIGYHLACPQGELKDINYDDGFGINFSYLTEPKFQKESYSVRFGARMDFATMRSKTFDNILVDDPSIVGDANIKAGNRMFGTLGLARLNFASENAKFSPYVDFLVGHRNLTTYQIISLNQPEDNIDFESQTVEPRVVHTKRFHYGAGVGFSYKIAKKIYFESSIVYTKGATGTVLPLQNITRAEGSNEVRYDNYKIANTDMLLVNMGIRIRLIKNYYNHNTESTNSSTNSNTTRPKEDTNTDRNRVPDPVMKDRNSRSSNTTPPAKKPIKIKSDGGKKDANDQS